MIPHFEGWHLLGAFPDGEPDDVGAWLLVSDCEAALLEIPPGLSAEIVEAALEIHGCRLLFATASHEHEDHFDRGVWNELQQSFPQTLFVEPSRVQGDLCQLLGREPVWLVPAPKHSLTDVVTVFRGVAMTGDIELGTLDSVNNEVRRARKRNSFHWLRDFEQRANYHIHSLVSAHLNDVRIGIEWPALFRA